MLKQFDRSGGRTFKDLNCAQVRRAEVARRVAGFKNAGIEIGLQEPTYTTPFLAPTGDKPSPF